MEDYESAVNAEPTENVVDSQTEQVETVEAVNADGGEVTNTEQEEKPIQTPEENAQFAAQRRARETELKQKAVDEYIAAQGFEWNGKPITTEAEYKQALYEQELQEKGQDPDEVKRLIEEHPDVKAARELRESVEQEQRQKAEYADFFQTFKKLNKRDFNAETDQIPNEVWEANEKGVPLKYAYLEHYTSQLETAEAKAKANQENAATSTGSVTGQGETGDGEISREMFEAKRGDREWLTKNLSKVTNSKWYKERYNN